MPIFNNISIDNRNHTISKPFILKNKTIEKFNSQYSIYENEVRFIDCVFENDFVLGNELNDEAYSILKTDLIFKNCIFNSKVYLDGIFCNGHIVFDNCSFNDKCVDGDYVLSITNSEIGIGIGIIRCNLLGGINLSATKIKSLGCQIFDTIIDNKDCYINLTKTYFGKELSIKISSIICKSINFENTALDTLQGSLQIGGSSFISSIEPEELSRKIFEKKINTSIDELYNLYTIYEKNVNNRNSIIIVKDDNYEFDNAFTEQIKEIFVGKEINNYYIKTKKEILNDDINIDKLTPIGNIVIGVKDDNLYYTIFAYDKFYCFNPINQTIEIIELQDYANIIFDFSDEELATCVFEYSKHISTFMIKATQGKKRYVAIYDSCQRFKIFRWNYIACSTPLVLSQAKVGLGLYFRQCEFLCPALDIRGLSCSDILFFEDIILNTKNVIAYELNAPNLVFRNVDYIINENSSNEFWINYEEDYNSNIKLSHSIIHNKLEIIDFFAHGCKDQEKFIIDLEFARIDNSLIFEYNGGTNSATLLIKSNNSKIKNLDLRSWGWNVITFEMGNCHFETLKLDGVQASSARKNSSFWKNMKTNLISSVTEGNILFLKTIENIFFKSDNSDWIKVWKYRNDLRIKQEHPRTFWLYYIWNRLFVNYGLHAWYLIIWLIIIMTIFDAVVLLRYHFSYEYSIINGFVEFLPVSFNTPIMDQLRETKTVTGSSIKDVLQEFFYSAWVTGYRVISYILFSVIIASFGGYFKGKNE